MKPAEFESDMGVVFVGCYLRASPRKPHRARSWRMVYVRSYYRGCPGLPLPSAGSGR